MIRQVEVKGRAIEYDVKFTKRRKIFGKIKDGKVRVFAPQGTTVEEVDRYVVENYWIIEIRYETMMARVSIGGLILSRMEDAAGGKLNVIEGESGAKKE